MRVLLFFLFCLCLSPLAAQDSPTSQTATEGDGGNRPLQIGLYGFSSRIGIDFQDQGQAVASFAVDMGHLYTNRLRFRPSAELGFGWGDNTYVVNAEIVYRFTADTIPVIPYIGGGVGLAGQEGCGIAPECPSVWAQFVLGFEVRMHRQFNWLVEYHPEDAFERHRLFVGLTTRRGR